MNSKSLQFAIAVWIFAVGRMGFSETFPNRPTAVELDELVTEGIVSGHAVAERDVVVNRDNSFMPYCGPWQPYFAALQGELEYLPTLYVDHVSGPLNDSQNDLRFFTLSTWQAAAGLSSNGFRRVTAQGSETFGRAQEGDLLGSWIYEDIGSGYTALKWTRWSNYGMEKNKKAVQGEYYYFSDFLAAWDNASWSGNEPGDPFYRVSAGEYVSFYYKSAYRDRGRFTLNALPAIPCSLDIYFRMDSAGTFTDIDGLGAVDGKCLLFGSLDLFGEEAEYTTGYYGDINENPWLVLGWTPLGITRSAGCQAWSAGHLLMKWKFEH